METVLNTNEIKEIANSSNTAKAIFNELGRRVRSRSRLDLRKLKYEILSSGNQVVDEEYVETFKKLQASGAGKLVSGRLGNPTRFIWNYKLKDVTNSAFEPETKVNEPGIKPVRRKSKTRSKHKDLSLAPITITFQLPNDIRSEDLSALMSLVKELSK
jgi:hypothetical protein